MTSLRIPLPGKRFVIGVPYTWLVVFFLFPFLILLYISFVDMGNDISPFKPIWNSETGLLHLKYENYWSIFRSADGGGLFKTIYIEAYLRSIWYALSTAVLCLLIGYPFSYFIARAKPSVRPALLMMVMLPFWTSFLLRVYAWKGILADQGVVNQLLMALGLINEPIQMLYTNVSMLVGMTYVYLPFMVLPLYTNLEKHDPSLLDAAQDLGANAWQRFWRVTFPLSLPGIYSGSALVFIPALGMFVIPEILGGTRDMLIGNLIKEQFLTTRDWPFGATLSIVLTLVVMLIAWLAGRLAARRRYA